MNLFFLLHHLCFVILQFQMKGFVSDALKLWDHFETNIVLSVSLFSLDDALLIILKIIFIAFLKNVKFQMGITPSLICLSLDVEHPADIILDLKQAMK